MLREEEMKGEVKEEAKKAVKEWAKVASCKENNKAEAGEK